MESSGRKVDFESFEQKQIRTDCRTVGNDCRYVFGRKIPQEAQRITNWSSAESRPLIRQHILPDFLFLAETGNCR